jgi:hypothetical protein
MGQQVQEYLVETSLGRFLRERVDPDIIAGETSLLARLSQGLSAAIVPIFVASEIVLSSSMTEMITTARQGRSLLTRSVIGHCCQSLSRAVRVPTLCN